MRYVLMFILYYCAIYADCSKKLEGIILIEEKKFLSFISNLLPNNPTILEAGGHYGIDTIRFAEMWPNGTILSFEPNPNAFVKLEMATQKYKNVEIFPIALAEYDGEAIFHVCYGDTGDNPEFEGASSLLETSDYMAFSYKGPNITVPCVVLDHWCQKNKIDHIDFMWLDLEGMELQVLNSSPKILETVKVILTETNFQEFRKGMTQYQELKDFLISSGFLLICHSYIEGIQGNAIFIRK